MSTELRRMPGNLTAKCWGCSPANSSLMVTCSGEYPALFSKARVTPARRKSAGRFIFIYFYLFFFSEGQVGYFDFAAFCGHTPWPCFDRNKKRFTIDVNAGLAIIGRCLPDCF